MNCPFDGAALQVMNRSGIEIDWCPDCRGVWLERGELDQLIDRVASRDPYGRPDDDRGSRRRPDEWEAPRRYDDDDDDRRERSRGGDDDRSRPRRKRGLLGEIFDF